MEDWARPVGGVGVETEPDRAPVSDTVAFIHGLIGQLVMCLFLGSLTGPCFSSQLLHHLCDEFLAIKAPLF